MRTLIILAALVGNLLAETITGNVVRVTDGDTITVLAPGNVQVKVRLAGIDAPENSQEYGEKSRQALAAMIAGKTVIVTEEGKDRNQRVIGWVKSGDIDANSEMVSQGWAWHFTQYNKDQNIARLQNDAKTARRGLWAAPNPPMAPWDYRALKRGGKLIPPAEKNATTPSTEEEKYWINSNGVRHNSGCRWYGKTKRGHYARTPEGEGCGQCGG